MDRRTDNLAEQLAQHTEGDEMIMMVIIRLRKVKSNKVDISRSGPSEGLQLMSF